MLHDPRRCARTVVLVGLEQSGVLGSLPADQGGSRDLTSSRDTGDDRCDALGHDLAGGDVVGHEQRLGTTDHDVVDNHAHQVEPDRVVLVHGLGDGDLGAHAIGAGRQDRTGHRGQHTRIEHSCEAAQTAQHLRPLRQVDRSLHQLDCPVACLNVHARAGVRDGRVLSGHGSVSLGLRTQGRVSASAAPPETPVPTPSASWRPGIGLSRPGSASRKCLPSRLDSGSAIG